MNKISGLRLFIEGLFEQGKELTTKEVISAVRMQLPNEKSTDTQITNAVYNMRRAEILGKTKEGKYYKKNDQECVDDNMYVTGEAAEDNTLKNLNLEAYVKRMDGFCAEIERIMSVPNIFSKIESDERACELYRLSCLNKAIRSELKKYDRKYKEQ